MLEPKGRKLETRRNKAALCSDLHRKARLVPIPGPSPTRIMSQSAVRPALLILGFLTGAAYLSFPYAIVRLLHSVLKHQQQAIPRCATAPGSISLSKPGF